EEAKSIIYFEREYKGLVFADLSTPITIMNGNFRMTQEPRLHPTYA
ncbi:2759_t:CDS:1, partial [Ambispora leptoticha]